MEQNSLAKRKQILQVRASYLVKDPKAFKGNSVERSEYLKQLAAIKPDLTPFQQSYLVGLILSDASVESNHSAKTARIKIQQRSDRAEWLSWVREVFLEYSASDGAIQNTNAARSTMVEYQTMKCTTIYESVNPVFYPKQARKTVTTELEQWINPVSLAGWLCGDGGTLNTAQQGGKGICLHSQGFTEEENKALVGMLGKKLGLKAYVKTHSTRGYTNVTISGESYDKFVELVGPYVHPKFFHRIPIGRTEGSRFGTMTEAKRVELLGSKLADLDTLIVNYNV